MIIKTRTGEPASVSIEQLRTAAAQVADAHALNLVVLFGSARHDDRPAEDIDLALRADRLLDLVALTNAFIQALRVQPVDLVDLRRADPLVMALVARDGIVVFEQTPGTFPAFASLAARRLADTRKFRDAERDAIREFVRETQGVT